MAQPFLYNFYNNLKFEDTMSDILYIIAVILIIGWLLGAFVFSLGALIHILLIFAVTAILFRLIRGRRL